MHSQWEELIPLYITGMLSSTERAALERHLAECDQCRRVLEEWRTTAAVVRDAAEQWSKGLPPLSPKLRDRVSAQTASQNGHVRTDEAAATILHLTPVQAMSQRSVDRRSARRVKARVPITLVAAVMTLFLLGGGLLFMAFQSPPEAETLAFGVTGTAQALATDTGDASQRVQGTPVPTQDDIGIIAVQQRTPTLTPSPVVTQPLPATATPLPPFVPTADPGQPENSGGVGGGGIPSEDTFSIASQPGDNCMVSTGSVSPVFVYEYPGTQYAVVGSLQPGDMLIASAVSGTGWFQVIVPAGGNWGWVNGTEVIVQGVSCASLQLPTPTAVSPQNLETTCMVLNTTGTEQNILSSPLPEGDVVGALAPGVTVRAFGRSVSGLLLIEFAFNTGVFSGWIDPSPLTVQGDCTTLPIIG